MRLIAGGAIWRTLNATLEAFMDSIIYLVGLIVVVLAVLSFFGLH